ncbi:MAG: hypothetical protein D6750_11425, partial [Bacteroidetes bacterium]
HLALLLAEWPTPHHIEKPLVVHSFLKAALFLTLGLAQKGYGGWEMGVLWYGSAALLAASVSSEPIPLAIETLLAFAVGRAGRTMTQGRRRLPAWMSLPGLVLGAGAIGVGFSGQVAALLPISAIFAGRMVPLWVKLRIDWPFLWTAQRIGLLWQKIGIVFSLLEWRWVRATNALARLHAQSAFRTTRIDHFLLVQGWEGFLRRSQRAVAQFFTPFPGMQGGLRWAFWVTLLIGFVWKLLR